MMYANGDIFEGMWAGDKKHGPGTHFYISKVCPMCRPFVWGIPRSSFAGMTITVVVDHRYFRASGTMARGRRASPSAVHTLRSTPLQREPPAAFLRSN